MTEMSPAEAIFYAAAEKPLAERDSYLADVCGADADLRKRVERMLAVRPLVGDFLERAPGGAQAASQDSGPVTGEFAGAQERIGAVIAGKYKLIEEIGEGGMGSVFMAQQKEPVKRAVAVKVIKAGMDSRAVLARFEAERQALAMMDHPNIARVLDAGTTDSGRPFFVMELVKGQPITQYCDDRKLTTRQRLELFVPVCQAIQHAHQKGVIHRDIKPSNVIVALYDDRPVPKVIDFGVAKAAGQSLTDKTLMTGFGAIVGTPEYMSPEQANLNNLDIDTRSDVYSLGVLLYELLTGSTPVDRKSIGKAALLEVLRIVREVEAPRPSARLSTIDTLAKVAASRGTEPAKLSKLMKGELDWVVLKALEKDRARRYETANGIAADIQRYLANEAVVARPPSAAYRLQKTWQRNRLAFVAGLAIAASLVIGIAASIWQAVRADHEARRAVAALDELRDTAPAFADQARGLAAKEQFDEAIEKLDYAAKLRPTDPAYLVAKGDLLQCQFRLAEATKAYRAALALVPDDARAKASADLCDELLATPRGKDGKFTRESLSKLHVAMQQQQRPAAELMPVARLLGEEKKLVVAYWLERLKSLPVSADKPLSRRLTVRDDGLLALDLSGTKVADLALLAGAPLAVLNVAGATELSNIAPLRGMNLIELSLADTKISDLWPLAKMQSLERLRLNTTPVTDLTPLTGLRLRHLDLTRCPVSDISSLRGAPLEELTLRYTRVSDLTALAGMPLKEIDLTSAPVLDFSALTGLPLEKCYLQRNRLTDLAVLRGMPLRELVLWGCADARNYAVLSDITTLELLLLPSEYRSLPDRDFAAIGALRRHPRLRQVGSEIMDQMGYSATGSKEAFWRGWDQEQQFLTPLRNSGFTFSLSKLAAGTYRLSVENQPLSDLSIFKGAPISELWLTACKVTDLAPIQNLPLRILGLYNNPVSDLSPLRGMPLEELSIELTKVSDLSPLAGMHLTKLYAHECEKLTDVSVLADMPTLEKLTVPAHARNIEALRKLPKLRRLAFRVDDRNPDVPGSTTEQFWDEYEKQAWLRPLRDAGYTKVWKQDDGAWYANFDGTRIEDLGMLHGAPIGFLSLADTAVRDLAPLRGIALRQLFLYRTAVTDLSPLQGMPIETLNIVSTKVADISALRGMPLVSLRLHDCDKLADMSPLADSKTLKELTLPANAKNIEMLRGLPKLERLSFRDDPSRAYRPDMTVAEFWKDYDEQGWARALRKTDLKISKLRRLEDGTWEVDLRDSAINDLAILKGAPISDLNISGTEITDLTPLHGMAIKKLALWGDKVTDLSPLEGAPIEVLHIGSTKVTDLAAVRAMPLTELKLHGCDDLTDLSPLGACKKLKMLTLPPNAKDFEFLRAMSNIERIGFEENAGDGWRPDKSAAEFWKDYDATKK